MKVSTILDHIDSGHMALPEFQRGYVWNRDQVRGLMDSMYRGHPVGSLLVWITDSDHADHRGGSDLAAGVVQLILDGQQRITTLYGIVRGEPPPFFDGRAETFTGLQFHLEDEQFAFYQPSRMKDDPLWIDVSQLMRRGNQGLGEYLEMLGQKPELSSRIGEFIARLNGILGIREADLHPQEVTGPDKTIDVVVDIFNRVNSGGTKLSQGDLALAKICASWPEGRERMKSALERWRGHGYHFDLDWLLRNVNAIVKGEARFTHLHGVPTSEIQNGLDRAERSIDYALTLISGRLGLDHDRVLFGRYALPVMTHYIDRMGGHVADEVERDRLLYWYFQSAMWGRFSGSVETTIDQDLQALEEVDGGLDRLTEQLRLWRGGLSVEPDHFREWSRGARFYAVLYALTRVGEAKDWGTGLPLRQGLPGRMNALEMHHIFPKAVLYKHGYRKNDVNAVSNFCFLTKDTNLQIGARNPDEYFRAVEARHPGVLASQWIPMDPELWHVENYPAFLEARRRLLAAAANALLDDLRHEGIPTESVAYEPVTPVAGQADEPIGGVSSADEEAALLELIEWVQGVGLPEGRYEHELAHPETGAPLAILDLAWPNGLQEGYSQPVAVLLDESEQTLQTANDHGVRHFTNVEMFKRYAENEVLVLLGDEAAGG